MPISPVSSHNTIPHTSQITPHPSHPTQSFPFASTLHTLEAPSSEPCCILTLWYALCAPFIALLQCVYGFCSNSAPSILTPTETPGITSSLDPSFFTPNETQGCPGIDPSISTSNNAQDPDAIATRVAQEFIYPNNYAYELNNPRKLAAYEKLTKERPLSGPIEFLKYSLSSRDTASQQPIFGYTPSISSVQGVFPYPPSSETTQYWTANFADPHIFGFCGGPLCAQDELQAIEFPAASHIKRALAEKGLSYMNADEICLMKNMVRHGILNTSGIYGSGFASAPIPQILNQLQLTSSLYPSNLFFIAAPSIPFNLSGQPYQKEYLERLFFPVYTAFAAIKEESGTSTPVINTGNWGAGAFGNLAMVSHLIQIAAAYCVGVDVIFYPLSQTANFDAALQLFEQIRSQYPQMSAGEFIDHLTQHAQEYGLVYGMSNGT